jgi:carbamoyltransferase
MSLTAILGISAYYHDAAAALLLDGEIVAAAQEERFSRRKHDPEFPARAAAYCLREAGLSVKDLDYVAFYDKPFIKFERLLQTYLVYAPAGLKSFMIAIPEWMGKKLWLKDLIQEKFGDRPVLFPQHHESHAAAAFFPSPFDQAAIITVDGVGEWTTTSYGVGRGHTLELLRELRFPHSLGLLYTAFTYFTGFKVNSGEYKLMGLAPYGEPRYVDLIKRELIDIKDDGSFRLNLKYFDYMVGLRMTNARFARLFDGPPRKPEAPIGQREMDLARSIQAVTEEIMLKMARHVRRETGMKNLCLAGGVALNCVANGLILRHGPFDDLWIQPAAGDAGGALGAALFAYHQYLGRERPPTPDGRDRQRASLLGPEFSADEIGAFLEQNRIPHRRVEPAEIPALCARLLAERKVVGWFQGRMEFGPRALGARSILGDARDPEMQKTMNLKIKFRESFRPFAPTVLAERAPDWFDFDRESPYMLLTAYVRDDRRAPLPPELEAAQGLAKLAAVRSSIPAVTHVDYSARLQTVSRRDNPLYYDAISAFAELTGCPVIINTSFNVRGEPIVCGPEDAYRCFMRTRMDYLFLGPFLLDKREQPETQVDDDWQKEFPPD